MSDYKSRVRKKISRQHSPQKVRLFTTKSWTFYPKKLDFLHLEHACYFFLLETCCFFQAFYGILPPLFFRPSDRYALISAGLCSSNIYSYVCKSVIYCYIKLKTDMRRNIVAGNWKSNQLFSQADELINDIAEKLRNFDSTDVDVIVCPPFPYLELVSDAAEDVEFFVGAQNVSKFDNGAYTGEVSAAMLQSMNIDYCIVGHSERRKYFFETNRDVAEKVDRLLKVDINPIVCVGELLEEREEGRHFDVIRSQVSEGLFHLSKDQITKVILAYEPVWAIGTGKTATKDQAQEMHAFIRGLIADKYSDDVAQEVSILYGGSCNAKNARELFAQPDVDGGLIGGASLKHEDFIEIACSF